MEAAEEGVPNQAPHSFAIYTVKDPRQGLKVEELYVVVDVNQDLPHLM